MTDFHEAITALAMEEELWVGFSLITAVVEVTLNDLKGN